MATTYINIAAYKFVPLEDLEERKQKLLDFCNAKDLKGTILLSLEGINLFLSGTRDNINEFVAHLQSHEEFADIPVKESPSDHQPHTRMLVRLKKEIISMGVDAIRPATKTSPKIQPEELRTWLDQNKDVALLDVRNDYEIELGTFENAIPIGIDTFRTFPDAVDELPDDLKKKPVVMFCTGGIRCEKAGPLMEEKGFEQIYQLDGGILKYFEDCGGDHYDGDCFVFDKRVAVDPELNETEADLCYACQAALSAEDQQSDKYDPPHSCPHCYLTDDEKRQRTIEYRNTAIKNLIHPLPGSVPYNNVRPLNVPLRFDHHKLIDVLNQLQPQMGEEYWMTECQNGLIHWKHEPIFADTVVRSGWRLEHLIPQTVEPDVNADIKILYEDEVLIIVDKPAPLPMHACGRFNRNSLKYILNELYQGEQIRTCHRLDANTGGVVICVRKKSAANHIQKQFEAGTIKKTYLAEVQNELPSDVFECNAPIAREPSQTGARIVDEANGQIAQTQFSRYENDDNRKLVRCVPITGRTNQIRIHLWHLGIPILGDPLYLNGSELGQSQTLAPNEPQMRLHAAKIEFRHPLTNDVIVFESKPAWL